MAETAKTGVQLDPNKEDFGFGKSYSQTKNRMITDQGQFNIERIGVSSKSWYHELIEMRWPIFLSLILAYYIAINLIFGFIYFIAGSERIEGITNETIWKEFYQCFFFSVQTFTTVGYGGMHPVGFLASGIAGFEALAGLLTLAIITSLVYAKFSKPRAKILYSDHVLIAPFKGTYGLQMRIANALSNTLIDMEATMIVGFTPEETSSRILRNLSLEISKIALFPLNWTLNHIIDDKSPLHGLDLANMEKYDMEVMILLRGFDESYNQNVHSMQSYSAERVVFNAKFKPMFEFKGGRTQLYLHKIGEYETLN